MLAKIQYYVPFHFSRISKVYWKSFGILYTNLILLNFAGEPEIQEVENVVSGGGDIVGGGGVKWYEGVYF